MNNALTKTTDQKRILVLRIIAGAPLFLFGIMHLVGAMPMRPLIEAAGLPMPGITAIVAPLAQILGGALLLSGAFARIGGVVAIGTMLGAIVTHIKIPNDAWPMPTPEDPNALGEEPVVMLAIAAVIILGSAYTIFKGAGPMSIDARCNNCNNGGCDSDTSTIAQAETP